MTKGCDVGFSDVFEGGVPKMSEHIVLSLECGTALQDYHFEENSTYLDV